jgi:hypothetical protein
MNNKSTSRSAILHVKGITWSGYNSQYDYSVDPDNPPNDYQSVKRIAGDFETVTSAKLIVNVMTIENTSTQKKIV